MRSTSVGADIAGVGDGTGKEYMHETDTIVEMKSGNDRSSDDQYKYKKDEVTHGTVENRNRKISG